MQFSNKNRPGIRVSSLYFVRSYPECCWRPITSVNPTTYLSEPIFQSNSFSKSCYSRWNTKWLNMFLDEFHSIRKLSDKIIWISCSSRFVAIRLLDIVMIIMLDWGDINGNNQSFAKYISRQGHSWIIYFLS